MACTVAHEERATATKRWCAAGRQLTLFQPHGPLCTSTKQCPNALCLFSFLPATATRSTKSQAGDRSRTVARAETNACHRPSQRKLHRLTLTDSTDPQMAPRRGGGSSSDSTDDDSGSSCAACHTPLSLYGSSWHVSHFHQLTPTTRVVHNFNKDHFAPAYVAIICVCALVLVVCLGLATKSR